VVRRLVVLAVLGGAAAIAVWLVSIGIKHVNGKKATPAPAKIVTLRIVFPEGFTRKQMAERIVAVNRIAVKKRHVNPRLSAKAYLERTASGILPGKFSGDKKRRQLEGFLFPATYDFTAKTATNQLVTDQLKAFKRNWAKVDLKYARKKNLTAYDVLNIASMVEAEVLAPEERELVSAVIYNRLHAHMPLGIDATIRYGLDIPPNKSLTKADLRNPTPYNTRIHLGLPPTPIGNPGLASIQAAAHPEKVDYLYFVRKPDKVHHFFTASYAAFIAYLRAHGYPTP
jgi:uncharacterized YceG family protein